MRDPFTWSLNLGRWFGIHVRVHIFFLIFVLIILLQQGGLVGDRPAELGLASLLVGLLFASVLLHEFGHCFAARQVHGHAEEIVIWPLGGLAFVEVANTPRAQLATTLGGPAVTLLLAAGCAIFLGSHTTAALNPFQNPIGVFRGLSDTATGGGVALGTVGMALHLNWILLLFNLLPAFPMDGGRLLRCVLWSHMGFGQATKWAVQTGKITAIVLGIFATVMAFGAVTPNFLLLFLAIFIFVMAEKERQMLETGLLFDDSVFGYDFSQGYTSLERDAAEKPNRPSAWRRWRNRKAHLRRERELAQTREEERRTDEILTKLHKSGMESLTDDERRFLSHVSVRYRNRLESGN
jgi:Zn-dependent protease